MNNQFEMVRIKFWKIRRVKKVTEWVGGSVTLSPQSLTPPNFGLFVLMWEFHVTVCREAALFVVPVFIVSCRVELGGRWDWCRDDVEDSIARKSGRIWWNPIEITLLIGGWVGNMEIWNLTGWNKPPGLEEKVKKHARVNFGKFLLLEFGNSSIFFICLLYWTSSNSVYIEIEPGEPADH